MAGLTTPIIAVQNYVIANQTLQLSNATAGGTWSSSNTGFCTISSTGLVTGVAAGSAVITYDVSGAIAVFSISVVANNITNGIDLQRVLNVATNRIKWTSQGSSNSGRYYQDFHAICDENIIKQLQSVINPDTNEYAEILSSLNRAVILDALNSIFDSPQLVDKPALIFNRSYPDRLYLQPVQNSGQLVGLTFGIAQGNFALSFKKLLLFFDKDATFTMYFYNDMNLEPISSFEVSVQANTQTKLDIPSSSLLQVLNYISTEYVGGRIFIAYYQDDIAAQGCKALFYNIDYQRFKVFQPMAFSAPQTGSVGAGNRNFNRTLIGANNLMYGMNAEVCSYIDASNAIVEALNSGLFDNLFGLLMPKKITEYVIFSYRNNKTQVNLQGNETIARLYAELNAVESQSGGNELNFSDGLRKRIESAKRVVKKGFQDKKTLIAGCG